MRNKKTLEMVQLAVLIAIMLIMAFTPLGFLRTAGLEISLLTIPVAIGAMSVGPGLWSHSWYDIWADKLLPMFWNERFRSCFVGN